MANVEKQMARYPARWPLTNLDACVRDFLWRRAPGGGMDVLADDIPAMCAEAGSLDEAVWIACASLRRSGKMHSHQTKVTKAARREFGRLILEEDIESCRTFHELYTLLDSIKPAGIGPLTTYDVATRVGAYLVLTPKRIYLHTGARQGWKALMGERAAEGLRRGAIPRNLWPEALLQLEADMAEDFLCTYRDTLLLITRRGDGSPA